MITEDYVSYEIAKLLKEKGFDVYGDGSFGSSTKVWMEYSPFGKIRDVSGSEPSIKGFPAPTLQMAMKWLREEHKIGVFPSTYTTIKGNDITHTYGTAIVNLNTYELMTLDSMDRETYEEACETAIKYCLENLI